jgi:hypothetical protein
MKTTTTGVSTIAAFLLSVCLWAQDFNQYEKLKEPQISIKPDQKMLVVESKGDPNTTAKEAFTKLFGAFFKLPGARMAAPRARWLGDLSHLAKEEWVGLFALPLPESVTSLPSEMEGVRIEEWHYGEVAEILHIGAYSEETPTIEKLQAFIKDRGYALAGPHEEEYLKGPGMAANPSQYWTIIRYHVKKR